MADGASVEKWRGWWVPAWEARPRLLSMEYDHDTDGPPEQRPRTTSWGVVTEARCKINPDHAPPVPECVCGLWGLNLLDVLFAWQVRDWERRFAEEHTAGMPKQPSSDGAASHVYVIGKVTLHDVLDNPIEAYPGLTLPHWRGRSARIREFWVPTSETQPARAATAMAQRLGALFGRVPVHVGAPGYGDDDWRVRTQFKGKGPAGVKMPDYPEIGLHPPSGSALTYPVVMPGRQDWAATVRQLLDERATEVMARREDLARAVAAQRAERGVHF